MCVGQLRKWILLCCLFLLFGCGGGGTDSTSVGTSVADCSSNPVTELQVAETEPANGQINVYVGTSISVTFNTCIDMSTINSSSFIVFGASGFVAGGYSFDPSAYKLTFTPSNNLNYFAAYAVTITTAAKSTDGKSLAADYGFGFITQTVPDLTAPTTTATPAGGNYNTSQTVTLTCDDGIDGTGCQATYYTLDGSTPTTSSSQYSAPIDITADTTLKYFSVDVAGNLEAVKTEQYTIDTTPPQVIGQSPTNGSSNVVLTTSITATFSESINATTLNSSTMTVDNGVTGTITYDDATQTVTYVPRERLACNTLHTVTLTTGVQDLAGNGLASNVSWTFTTHTDCDEPVTTADLSSGMYTTVQSVTLTCTDTGGSGCSRIVYTTDGSVPGLAPVNGTVVNGSSAGPIAMNEGNTVLRFFAEDAAGNGEVLREKTYAISTNGFVYAATNGGLSRGVGIIPTSFTTIKSEGKTHCYFFDSSNNRFYRGTARGVVYSDDGGSTWVQSSLMSGGVYVPVRNIFAQGSRIYLATWNGLYVSTDGGGTFELRPPAGGLDTDWVTDVYVTDSTVYAATLGGFSLSANKGYSFVNRTTADGLGSNRVNDIEVSGTTIYAATDGGLSISTDGGSTFGNRTTADGLPDDEVNAVAVSGSTVYVATPLGLSISSDGGVSFTATRTTADGIGNNYISEVYVSGSTVYVGSGNPVISSVAGNAFSVSTDGGVSFSNYSVDHNVGDDVHVTSLFLKDTTLYVGAYPTYYTSTDNGATFQVKGLPTDFFDKVVVDSNGTLYAAVQDSAGYGGVAVSSDGGFSFDFRNPNNGLGDDDVYDLHVDGTTVYAGTWGGLSITTNTGSSWVNRTDSDGLSSFITDAVFASGTTVYAATGGSAIDISTDAGLSFTTLKTGIGTTNGLVASGANIYAATTNGLQISTDGGATFTNKTTSDGLGDNYLYDVAVSGSDVYAGTINNGLSISTDGGQSFSVAPNLNNAGVYSVHLFGSDLYAATSSGLAYSTDGGQSFSWRTTAHGLPTNTIKDVWYVP